MSYPLGASSLATLEAVVTEFDCISLLSLIPADGEAGGSRSAWVQEEGDALFLNVQTHWPDWPLRERTNERCAACVLPVVLSVQRSHGECYTLNHRQASLERRPGALLSTWYVYMVWGMLMGK